MGDGVEVGVEVAVGGTGVGVEVGVGVDVEVGFGPPGEPPFSKAPISVLAPLGRDEPE